MDLFHSLLAWQSLKIPLLTIVFIFWWLFCVRIRLLGGLLFQGPTGLVRRPCLQDDVWSRSGLRGRSGLFSAETLTMRSLESLFLSHILINSRLSHTLLKFLQKIQMFAELGVRWNIKKNLFRRSSEITNHTLWS